MSMVEMLNVILFVKTLQPYGKPKSLCWILTPSRCQNLSKPVHEQQRPPEIQVNKYIVDVTTVDGSEIRRSPVEVGSLSQYLEGFYTSQVVVWDFFHQQYD